jgi:PAS domain S-box-containing protein
MTPLPPPAHRGRFSILYLEDNPLDVELVQECLRSSGLDFELSVAGGRAQFEALYPAHHFDLILADYSLPDFDGLSALRIVRARDSRQPFVFISGVLGEDVAVETLLQGATDYVLKTRPERLLPAVHRALAEFQEHVSRQRAEQELHQIEQRFRTITNSLPAMVWTCNREGRLTFTNALWQKLIGDADRWFSPQTVHPSDLARCEAAWNEAQRNGSSFEVDCRYRMRDDSRYSWNLVRATPLPNPDGSVTEWVGTCTDTEQQKARESQFRITEKLALTGRLASVIAHEINNPLEALTNILYLMRSACDTSELRSYLALADHELVRVSAITKQTLQWSRDEVTVSEISAQTLIDDALKLFFGKLKNKRIQLERDIDAGVRVRVVAGEVRQVIANLLSNAIDALPTGGRIRLRAGTETRAGKQMALLAVEDNGEGIAPDVMANLFKPFQSTKGALGTGLGLYVSRELVDRYGGELAVRSTPGQGTAVIAYFPLG